ncbi:MAG: DNA repair protein RecO [Xanthomonadales bacterium]
MRFTLEPAYILHSRQYRESSLLLEAFSREHGKVGLVARGARGAKSRWKNMLQPFRPLLLSWNQRGELGTLTGADQVASPPALVEESLFCGLYANELMVRFLYRSDPHPGLFDYYRHLLTQLAAGEQPQPLLRIFEKQLLQSAGFGLQLDQEYGSDRVILAEAWYSYQPEAGPVRCERGQENDVQLISGSALLALKSEQIEDRHLKELRRLMRRLIRNHLGDKPIASQALFT